jgi:hypothetical protein
VSSDSDSAETPPGRRKAVVLAVSLVVVVLLGVGAFAIVRHGQGKAPAAAPAASVATIAVQKTDLTDTQSFTGTLGFGTPQPLKGTGAGVVTKLPATGYVAERGKPLYSVNDIPVPVFFGGTPLFRKLDAPGLQGSDVAMVADNLAALGYKTGTHVSDPTKATFTPTLIDALKKWQRHAGLDDTGTLDVGQLVVVAGAVRVNAVSAQLGDPAAGPLMTVTPTEKVVTVPVDPTSVGSIKTGAPVTIVRPDNKNVPGKVTAISTAVDGSTDSAGGTSAGGQNPPKVNIMVVPDDEGAVSDLDSASVQVEVTTQTHAGVLAVPVGALVALREGGYAVQLPSGALKAVQTGMFSKDLVEISGAGITEGLQVVTTS